MTFLKPTNNYAFLRVFGDENHKPILISFLNSVLELPGGSRIVAIEYLRSEQVPRIEGLKATLLDIRCKDERGITYIVEMQVSAIEGLSKRIQLYMSKAYAGQIKSGEDYPKLNQVIFIGIFDFQQL